LRPGTDHRRGANPATALIDCAVSAAPLSRLLGFFEKYPRLASTIFWSFSCETAMYAEHLINVGRRSALEPVADFLLELSTRLQAIGLADEHSFQMPLTQELSGDR
jgi:CRP-like cAMP-binding protein